MILDNEGQRVNLLNIIKEVPIQATMEDAIEIINMLKGLQHAVQSAEIVCASTEGDLKVVDNT